jgi:ABC-type multidrug transport system fused ATPase/permease subunit
VTVDAPPAAGTSQQLPVAERAEVRRAFRRLLMSEKRRVSATIGLHLVATVAGTVAPLLLGRIIDDIAAGGSVADVDRLGLALGASVVAVIAFTWAGTYVGHRLGERLSAKMREQFVERCLRLPLPVVERAGSGDLMTRSSADVPEAGGLFREGVPQIAVSVLKVAVYFGAMLWVSPLLALCMLVAVPSITYGTRWYLKRARAGYLRERHTESAIGETIAASADGARTTEAYRLADHRREAGDRTVADSWSAVRYTLFLRSVFFPFLDATYALPTVAVLFIGGAFYFEGSASLGMVVTCAVLTRQIMFPRGRMLLPLERVCLPHRIGRTCMCGFARVAENLPV